MMSAAPAKRMVSSVFITLASPYRATVTPNSHIHSTKARDPLSSALPLSPGYSPSEPQLAQRRPSAASQDGHNRTQLPSPAPASAPEPIPAPPSPVTTVGKDRVPDRGESPKQKPPTAGTTSDELFPAPPPVTAPLELLADAAIPPPPPPSIHSPHLTPSHLQPPPPTITHEAGAPAEKQLVERHPSGGGQTNEQLQTQPDNMGDDVGRESKDLCGFCRKSVALSESAIEALNRTYHATCFQCRQCHVPLAGKLYYNKAGIPLCEECYQASLELCWACGEVIKDHVIRGLERAYHPSCFVCTTCRQPIGEQRFAQGEVGEVYCLQDYYRKYAPQCSACELLIIPREDGTDSFTVECLGRSFHEDCYRCEVCRLVLSPEPNEQGCHPLEGQILCKPCHLTLVQRAQQ
ncbi:filamin-binding LIM protein 1 [Clupea harengus]|uniref:Filamin-binding LIM protein 1 n=1 Tax=Clupea harengus TaxID=7950 RepID=A0A6P8FKT5_CLUHA|nr:filamin-binding LIM protein 1 [Clupea harengus]